MYLACDSFTSQWQSKVYKQYSVHNFQMMLGINVWSCVMTGTCLKNAVAPNRAFLLNAYSFPLFDPPYKYHRRLSDIFERRDRFFLFHHGRSTRTMAYFYFIINFCSRPAFHILYHKRVGASYIHNHDDN